MVDWQNVFDSNYDMCFACGEKNPIGMKLKFQWDGKTARAEFTPGVNYQGWPGVLHGGLIANMLDEAAGWAMIHNGMFGVTARMEVLYHSPAEIGTPLVITGSISKTSGKRVTASSQVMTKQGELVAEANTLLVVMKEEPETKTFAVIWDMDGVIVDTAEYHFKSWQQAFKKQGVNFTAAGFRRRFGQRNDAIIRSVLDREVTREEIETIARDKETYFRKAVKDKVKPHPGAVELIKSLAKHGIKMAVASSAPPENIKLLIGNLKLTDCFRQLVSGREVTESKPSPQLFLFAAKKLGVKPEHCVVIEDAVAGVEAAKRAGMRCIGLTTTNPPEKLQQADLVVTSLAELKVSSFEKLIKNNRKEA